MNGRKTALLGLGLNLLLEIIVVPLSLFFNLGSVYFEIVGLAAFAIAAFGFLLSWLESKDITDLLVFSTLGLNCAVRLLVYLVMGRTENDSTVMVSSLINNVLVASYFLAFAIKAKKLSILFSGLFLCAFLFNLFAGVIMQVALGLGLAKMIIVTVMQIGYIVCAGLCYLEAKNDS